MKAMNVLFLTVGRMDSIEARSLYPDLLREFRNNGHQVYTVSPRERRNGLETELVEKDGAHMIYVKIGNITKCNLIEKGISTLMIERQFKAAIKKHFSNVKFDLVVYSTPPITLAGVVDFIKHRDNARSYLLLKDIFPQNAVDLGMMQKSGVKGYLYKYFRMKEKKLYALSDTIGCMSQANREYVIKHNPEVNPVKVEVCPNCIEPVDMSLSAKEKEAVRKKYGLPLDKKIFIYGGNLGKPQDVRFIVECFKACEKLTDVYFVVAGSGTDRHYLEEYVGVEKPAHVKLLGNLPKAEYDAMVACCDVGLIFLDHRFTIPNFPSRLLAYMQAGLPVLACTDPNTDVGKVIVEGGFGWWCESDNTDLFVQKLKMLMNDNTLFMGKKAIEYLENEYTVQNVYDVIVIR